ncbi:hypothetical protein EDC04DRAFT_534477 [Pisolithus marmoratus]|nr:hypothetical protein EDC04DRAFT_534477 [Pisolithus marmoratus]
MRTMPSLRAHIILRAHRNRNPTPIRTHSPLHSGRHERRKLRNTKEHHRTALPSLSLASQVHIATPSQSPLPCMVPPLSRLQIPNDCCSFMRIPNMIAPVRGCRRRREVGGCYTVVSRLSINVSSGRLPKRRLEWSSVSYDRLSKGKHLGNRFVLIYSCFLTICNMFVLMTTRRLLRATHIVARRLIDVSHREACQPCPPYANILCYQRDLPSTTTPSS